MGEGKITFSTSPEHLRFYTKWTVEEKDGGGVIESLQEVEMEGNDERLKNAFTFHFTDLPPKAFSVQFSNDLLGVVAGKGLVDGCTIAWEFRGHPEFEGFEVYELQDNGDYMLHVEYLSTDKFRTVIDGRVWKKSV